MLLSTLAFKVISAASLGIVFFRIINFKGIALVFGRDKSGRDFFSRPPFFPTKWRPSPGVAGAD